MTEEQYEYVLDGRYEAIKDKHMMKMTENKRFELAYEKGNWWAVRDGEITLWKEEVIGLLNEQEKIIKRLKTIREEQIEVILKQKEKIKELETRNQRQYERLKEIIDLMQNRDWKALEQIVEDWEQAEEQLEREWGTYGDAE